VSLEDVADKARRNLMAVSSGIMAVWALDIPLDGKLVGAVNLSSVEPWRAWATASAVLLYFALRHYFAPATAKEWGRWTYRRKLHINSQLQKVVADAFNLVPGSTADKLELKWYDMRAVSALTYSLALPEEYGRRGTFEYSWHYASSQQHAGPVTLPDGTPCPTPLLEGEYAFSRSFFLASHWRAICQAYRPSWHLLELSFPWVVAFGAAVVCACKLATSLYYSFPFVRQLLSA